MSYYKLGSGTGMSIAGLGSAIKKVRKVAHKVSPAHILYNKVTKTRRGNKQAARSVAQTRQAANRGNPVARREMATMQTMNAAISERERNMGYPPPPPVPVEVPYEEPEMSEEYADESETYEDEE